MSSTAYEQKEKTGSQPPRDRVVNVRFTEDELNVLDDRRGSRSRSEFLRDFEGRDAGAGPECAAEGGAGCPDLETLTEALFRIEEQIINLRSRLWVAKEEHVFARWRAKDEGRDPDSVSMPDDVVALAEDTQKLVDLLDGINLALLGCGRGAPSGAAE